MVIFRKKSYHEKCYCVVTFPVSLAVCIGVADILPLGVPASNCVSVKEQ